MTEQTKPSDSPNSLTPRATKRPDGFKKPAHWSNDPAPEPKAGKPDADEPRELSPTRYGDWEKNGIAIDF